MRLARLDMATSIQSEVNAHPAVMAVSECETVEFC
jgi:hypothetical protein